MLNYQRVVGMLIIFDPHWCSNSSWRTRGPWVKRQMLDPRFHRLPRDQVDPWKRGLETTWNNKEYRIVMHSIRVFQPTHDNFIFQRNVPNSWQISFENLWMIFSPLIFASFEPPKLAWLPGCLFTRRIKRFPELVTCQNRANHAPSSLRSYLGAL